MFYLCFGPALSKFTLRSLIYFELSFEQGDNIDYSFSLLPEEEVFFSPTYALALLSRIGWL
jgi:hypothetical protein